MKTALKDLWLHKILFSHCAFAPKTAFILNFLFGVSVHFVSTTFANIPGRRKTENQNHFGLCA